MLTYFLNARGKESKYRFLYNAIRSDILAKKLLPGERLPSKRALAEHLGLSLSTVGSAYAALLDEGYLEVKARSGFFVSALTLPENGNANRTDKADFQPANAAEAARTPEGSDKNADANTEAAISETEPSAPHPPHLGAPLPALSAERWAGWHRAAIRPGGSVRACGRAPLR